MKFSKFMLVLILTFISIVAVGCGGTAETPQKNNSTAVEGEEITVPEERPALIGKVKEIVGNEVTVYKAQVAQNEGTSKEEPANQAQNQDNRGGRPEFAGFEMKFTEETETILIPVGVPIVTMQRGANVKQVELTKITKDTILRIWKKDGTVSFIQVLGGNRSYNTGQGEENKGQGTGGGMPPDMGGGPPPDMGGGPPPNMGGNN